MRKAWGVGVLLVVAISAFAVAQKGPKERDSTRGEPFRVVVVQPVLSAATRFVDRNIDYAETKEVATVLAQLNAEGYDPVQIEALNEDALAILAKLR
jgi:hypothetical protein